MKPFLVILPYCSGDFPLALGLLEWIMDLGGARDYPLLLIGSKGSLNVEMLRLKQAGEAAFGEVFTERAPGLPDETWPRGANVMFRHACRHVLDRFKIPFLWLEPDCVPMRPGWLDAISNEYARCGQPFMGNVRRQTSNPELPSMYLPGCSVYPGNSWTLLNKHWEPINMAWDVATAGVTVSLAFKSPLFYEWWGLNGKPPLFKSERKPSDPENVMVPGQIPRESVIFHRSKDGRLIDILRGQSPRPRSAPNAPEPVKLATVPSVHISLLCFNRLDLTRQCLASLEANTGIPYALTITDNASSDGTADYLDRWQSSRPHVRLVSNAGNLGYQEPHNAAFTYATTAGHPSDFFVILNNDIDLGAGWLEAALSPFEHNPKLALVGSSSVCSRLTEHMHGTHGPPHEPPEYIEGSLLVIRTAIVSKLAAQLFDPNLTFIYCEDTDLSLRVREAGYRIKTVNLNSKHLYNQTVKQADPVTKDKIKRCQIANVEYLKKRWSIYIRRRDFRYQVLITRRYAMGDVIDVTAILPAIKAKWPESQIIIETDIPPVFFGNPHVASVVKSGGDRDVHYDLTLAYERQPSEHVVKSYADACGVSVDLSAALPELFQTQHEHDLAAFEIPSAGATKWCVLHPGPTHWLGRDWPSDNWKHLNRELIRCGWKTVVIGNGDGVTGVSHDARGRLSLGVLSAVIKRASLFVGLDSGPSHIAQAVGTKSVVLFGTVLPEFRLYPAAKAVPVIADRIKVPCVGEHHRLPPPIEMSQCRGDCMRAITVPMVMDAVERITK